MKRQSEKRERVQKTKPKLPPTDLSIGLTSAEAERRAREYGDNSAAEAKTKSIASILKENLLTFFNILNAALAALIIFAGAYSELVFMLVIISNLAIGLFQEIKAKRTLDKLSLLSMGKIYVIRDGGVKRINSSKLVIGDIIKIKLGDQLPCDCVVREGALEVNESLVSGETDDILKSKDDLLFSGSIVVSGEAAVEAVSVGADSYTGKISAEAKTGKNAPSKIRYSIRRILKIISVIVIPVGALTFARQYSLGEMSLKENIVRTAASMIGMIPEGLFLITGIAMCAGAIILSYKKTLVQDMYAIESLAYVDTLCLDKTGTLTLGAMTVENAISLDRSVDLKKMLGRLVYVLEDDNATMAALKHAYLPVESEKLLAKISFSSDRKYSAADFEDIGTVTLGAYEVLFGEDERSRFNEANSLYFDLIESGKRVLTLAVSKNHIADGKLPAQLYPAAFVIISDSVKPSAKRTIEYFYSQGVDIKVISGDHPKTVSEIAKICGVKNAGEYLDTSRIKTDGELARMALSHSVFGRVTPNQKKIIIKALKDAGRTVSMTGDGVNDVPALREADCSVAMASGAQAACNVSTMVLLNSDFDAMPAIVDEGRKAVNNLQRSAALFITKTIYAILAAVLSLTVLEFGYPYTPLQLTLLSFVTIGFPAFFLAFEPNYSRIRGSFMGNVFARSLPGGVCAALGIILCDVYGVLSGADYIRVSSLCIMVTFITAFAVLIKISLPLNKFRSVIIAVSGAIFLICYFAAPRFAGVSALTDGDMLFMLCMAALMPALFIPVNKLFNFVFKIKKDKRSKAKSLP